MQSTSNNITMNETQFPVMLSPTVEMISNPSTPSSNLTFSSGTAPAAVGLLPKVEVINTAAVAIIERPATEAELAEERDRKVFMLDLNKFMAEMGKPLSKIPIMGYKELDLFQLFREVTAYGGFNEVVKNVGTWSKIWKRLGNFDPSITDSSFRLKKNYERYLLDYEFKCFPENRKQAAEMEKQLSIKKSTSYPTSLSDVASAHPTSPSSNPSASWALKNSTGSMNLKASASSAKKFKKSASFSASIPSLMMRDIIREKDGSARMPLILGDLTIESLGTIIARPPYITEKFIWPIGFTSSRVFASMHQSDTKVKYTSKIIDGGDRPQFMISASDDPIPIISHSASSAWRTVLKRVASAGGAVEKSASVNGAQRFGVSHPTVTTLIKELPNGEKCVGIQNSIAESDKKKKRKTSSEPSSGSEDSSDSSSKMSKHDESRYFSTREELEDLESAVATLYSLKFCTVY